MAQQDKAPARVAPAYCWDPKRFDLSEKRVDAEETKYREEQYVPAIVVDASEFGPATENKNYENGKKASAYRETMLNELIRERRILEYENTRISRIMKRETPAIADKIKLFASALKCENVSNLTAAPAGDMLRYVIEEFDPIKREERRQPDQSKDVLKLVEAVSLLGIKDSNLRWALSDAILARFEDKSKGTAVGSTNQVHGAEGRVPAEQKNLHKAMDEIVRRIAGKVGKLLKLSQGTKLKQEDLLTEDEKTLLKFLNGEIANSKGIPQLLLGETTLHYYQQLLRGRDIGSEIPQKDKNETLDKKAKAALGEGQKPSFSENFNGNKITLKNDLHVFQYLRGVAEKGDAVLNQDLKLDTDFLKNVGLDELRTKLLTLYEQLKGNGYSSLLTPEENKELKTRVALEKGILKVLESFHTRAKPGSEEEKTPEKLLSKNEITLNNVEEVFAYLREAVDGKVLKGQLLPKKLSFGGDFLKRQNLERLQSKLTVLLEQVEKKWWEVDLLTPMEKGAEWGGKEHLKKGILRILDSLNNHAPDPSEENPEKLYAPAQAPLPLNGIKTGLDENAESDYQHWSEAERLETERLNRQAAIKLRIKDAKQAGQVLTEEEAAKQLDNDVAELSQKARTVFSVGLQPESYRELYFLTPSYRKAISQKLENANKKRKLESNEKAELEGATKALFDAKFDHLVSLTDDNGSDNWARFDFIKAALAKAYLKMPHSEEPWGVINQEKKEEILKWAYGELFETKLVPNPKNPKEKLKEVKIKNHSRDTQAALSNLITWFEEQGYQDKDLMNLREIRGGNNRGDVGHLLANFTAMEKSREGASPQQNKMVDELIKDLALYNLKIPFAVRSLLYDLDESTLKALLQLKKIMEGKGLEKQFIGLLASAESENALTENILGMLRKLEPTLYRNLTERGLLRPSQEDPNFNFLADVFLQKKIANNYMRAIKGETLHSSSFTDENKILEVISERRVHDALAKERTKPGEDPAQVKHEVHLQLLELNQKLDKKQALSAEEKKLQQRFLELNQKIENDLYQELGSQARFDAAKEIWASYPEKEAKSHLASLYEIEHKDPKQLKTRVDQIANQLKVESEWRKELGEYFKKGASLTGWDLFQWNPLTREPLSQEQNEALKDLVAKEAEFIEGQKVARMDLDRKLIDEMATHKTKVEYELRKAKSDKSADYFKRKEELLKELQELDKDHKRQQEKLDKAQREARESYQANLENAQTVSVANLIRHSEEKALDFYEKNIVPRLMATKASQEEIEARKKESLSWLASEIRSQYYFQKDFEESIESAQVRTPLTGKKIDHYGMPVNIKLDAHSEINQNPLKTKGPNLIADLYQDIVRDLKVGGVGTQMSQEEAQAKVTARHEKAAARQYKDDLEVRKLLEVINGKDPHSESHFGLKFNEGCDFSEAKLWMLSETEPKQETPWDWDGVQQRNPLSDRAKELITALRRLGKYAQDGKDCYQTLIEHMKNEFANLTGSHGRRLPLLQSEEVPGVSLQVLPSPTKTNGETIVFYNSYRTKELLQQKVDERPDLIKQMEKVQDKAGFWTMLSRLDFGSAIGLAETNIRWSDGTDGSHPLDAEGQAIQKQFADIARAMLMAGDLRVLAESEGKGSKKIEVPAYQLLGQNTAIGKQLSTMQTESMKGELAAAEGFKDAAVNTGAAIITLGASAYVQALVNAGRFAEAASALRTIQYGSQAERAALSYRAAAAGRTLGLAVRLGEPGATAGAGMKAVGVGRVGQAIHTGIHAIQGIEIAKLLETGLVNMAQASIHSAYKNREKNGGEELDLNYLEQALVGVARAAEWTAYQTGLTNRGLSLKADYTGALPYRFLDQDGDQKVDENYKFHWPAMAEYIGAGNHAFRTFGMSKLLPVEKLKFIPKNLEGVVSLYASSEINNIMNHLLTPELDQNPKFWDGKEIAHRQVENAHTAIWGLPLHVFASRFKSKTAQFAAMYGTNATVNMASTAVDFHLHNGKASIFGGQQTDSLGEAIVYKLASTLWMDMHGAKGIFQQKPSIDLGNAFSGRKALNQLTLEEKSKLVMGASMIPLSDRRIDVGEERKKEFSDVTRYLLLQRGMRPNERMVEDFKKEVETARTKWGASKRTVYELMTEFVDKEFSKQRKGFLASSPQELAIALEAMKARQQNPIAEVKNSPIESKYSGWDMKPQFLFGMRLSDVKEAPHDEMRVSVNRVRTLAEMIAQSRFSGIKEEDLPTFINEFEKEIKNATQFKPYHLVEDFVYQFKLNHGYFPKSNWEVKADSGLPPYAQRAGQALKKMWEDDAGKRSWRTQRAPE